MIERRVDPDERVCQRLARAVIALAIRDATEVPTRNAFERDSARHFLLEGAPGWAEVAGLSSDMIARHYAKARLNGWPPRHAPRALRQRRLPHEVDCA